ncbi:hypothetical protein SUGI_0486920 [Cryptomeria japonica]|nr:hypothetical protein SUGI_0486920 [Cryptomeria japonica]
MDVNCLELKDLLSTADFFRIMANQIQLGLQANRETTFIREQNMSCDICRAETTEMCGKKIKKPEKLYGEGSQKLRKLKHEQRPLSSELDGEESKKRKEIDLELRISSSEASCSKEF